MSARATLSRRPPRARARGTIVILCALLMTVLIGFAGLALDAGILYYRKVQLQALADNAALAAALRLNGTQAGIEAAATRAADTAAAAKIGLRGRVTWVADALRFADDPDATEENWRPAASAPLTVRYARVDIARLGNAMRRVQPVLMAALGESAPVSVGGVAIAGPTMLKVAPLAVCAMGAASAKRAHVAAGVDELVEYGFRYGVGYNLLHLNPQPGASTGAWFLVDPVTPPGTAASEAASADDAVAPFLCSGTLAYSRIGSAPLNVRRPAAFNLAAQMNSRFGSYGGTPACTLAGAPPDRNIKQYNGSNASWMQPAPVPTRLTAAPTTPSPTEPLRTIADLPPPLATVAAGEYGIRWAYGPAKLHPAGSGNIPTTRWSVLYPSATAITGTAGAYPAGPYNASNSSSYVQVPEDGPGRRDRRLLHVPLLDCTAPVGTQATVRAIGRFLLTAAATATEVPGEFAGIVDEAALAGGVELYR